MVSSINLGNFSAGTNGTTPVTNLSSAGLDITALIKAATDAKGIPATTDQTTITNNNNIITALGTMQNQLTSLMNASESLTNVFDSNGNQSNDVFNNRAAFITSNTAVAGSTYMGVTANNNAAIANYNMTVGALAQTKIQSTNTFSSQTASATQVQGGAAPNLFSAGTFQITGGQAQSAVGIASGDVITSASITSNGTVGSTVLDSTFGTGGIGGITVTGTGDKALIGSLSGLNISGAQSGGAGTPVTLTMAINGSTYTSNAITANTGGSSNQIAAGTVVTLTNSTTGTSFQVRVTNATTISNNSDLSNFAANVGNDLSGITFYQSHQISSFNQAAAAGTTTLANLVSTDVKLNSSEFNPSTGAMGDISNFIVTAESAPGANDATMQVTINGETYTATGLNGTQNTNITLTSATNSNNTLTLNLVTPGISLNLSTNTAAKQVQADLNTSFGTGVNITLNQGDSLQTIASKINSSSATSGLSATVLEIDSTHFQLSLQSTVTGVINAYNINDTANGTMSHVTLTNVQSASDASFTINNPLVTLTRPTNQVTDAIPGVTLNLFQQTPGGTTLQVQVQNDGTGIQTAITNFVTAYNNFKTFAAEQQQINSNGSSTSTAYLGKANDSVLRTLLPQVQSELNAMVTGLSPSAKNSLASIGITFGDQAATSTTPVVGNTLVVNSSMLTSAIATNPQEVQGIFDQMFNSSANNKLQVFSATKQLTVNNFGVTINSSAPVGQQVSFSYNDSLGAPHTVYGNFNGNSGGGVITGASNTPFAGLTLLYVGSGNDTITGVSLTQGITAQLFNTISPLLAQNGAIATEVNSYNSQNTTLNGQITTINQQVSDLRTQLLNKYAALNAAIAKSNNILNYLNIQAGILTGGHIGG